VKSVLDATTNGSTDTVPSDELLLIDLSSIVHPIWHMSQSEPDPDATSIKSVDRVRQLAARFPTAAICCDSGKSFRKELDPTYKAQRPQQEAPLRHQMRLATERLRADGFPVWCIDGFEADDVIATAVTKALAIEGTRVLIATADKDLLQLVGPRVSAKNVRDGAVLDAEAVKAKFGVTPEQMCDYLCLVGDASDNVIGAKGIGPKRAAELLALFGSLNDVYAAIDKGAAKLPQGVLNSLIEFRDRLPNVRALIAVRTDVEIPFEEIAAERMPKDVAPADEDSVPQEQPVIDLPRQEEGRNGAAAVTASAAAAPRENIMAHGNGHALAVIDAPAPPPAEWEKQLEPRSIREAQTLATSMFTARLFNGYGSKEAVLSTVLAGRELGMPAIASLRGFHIVEGKHCLAADAIRALVMRSGKARFFRCTERTDTKVTFEAQRGEDPPLSLSYTIEDAQRAGVVKKGSGWEKHPADMLVARASSKLARLMFPDVVFGLYSPEEFD
jgi:5'-3' exonuclease